METASPPAPGSKRDRLVSALLLFLPLALWPAAAAAAAWRVGDTPGSVLALACVALVAIPAGATGLGFGWARKLTEAFALAGMVIGILFVLRNGLSLIAAPAVGYFVVYAFLSHERFRTLADKPKEPPPAEHPLAWVKENVEAIAVAFIMALVIRCFCVEVFKIPSSSMEPTLLGDNPAEGRGGDRIMVTKLTYAVQDVGRFEPVVFKFPLNPMKNFIKRVVGLPKEKFVLYQGNVYTLPDGSPDSIFRIRRKSLRIQRGLWIDAWNRRARPLLQSVESFEDAFGKVRDATIREGVLTGGPSEISWSAERITDAGTLVNDILFEADVELQQGPGEFWIRIEHDFGPFKLQLSPSGGSALFRAGESHALKTPAFPAGRRVHVEFMVYDGQAFVLFDGRVQAELVFQETLDQAVPLGAEEGFSFGARGVKFALTKLRVGQDIHYKAKSDPPMDRGKPLEIPADKYFMLGDNVNNSHDGRAWLKYTVILKTGEVVEFESQALIKEVDAKRAWAKRHGKPEPFLLIEADSHGHERALDYTQLARDGKMDTDNFNFVEGRFIIGRAFAVCWPLARCLRLIR